MSNIFLSRSSRDNEHVQGLYAFLKSQEYEGLFLDFHRKMGFLPGETGRRNCTQTCVSAGLSSCSVAGIRWPHGGASQRLHRARALGKHLFPIKVTECEVTSLLTDVQVIDADAIGWDEAYRRLQGGLLAAGLNQA